VKTQKKRRRRSGAGYKMKKKTYWQRCPGKSALTFVSAFVVVAVLFVVL